MRNELEPIVRHLNLHLRRDTSFHNKMASIFVLPSDVFLYILRYLDIHDRIALAMTCRMFRQMCVDEGVFRKMDLSRSLMSTMQRKAVDRLLRDRQLTQRIRELNVSNHRVLNWHMDDHLENIMPICCHLETLHVLNCGMSFQRLLSILKQAPKLTGLSWSLWDFTSKDIQFLEKSLKSSKDVCLKNIKHLHLDIPHLSSHVQIAKYLLLCFKELRELEIRIWSIDKYSTGQSLPLAPDEMIPDFPRPSDENELQHLRSLVVTAVGGPLHTVHETKLFDFVVSLVSRKSSATKWEKLWIPASVDISSEYWSLILDSVNQDDFQSVEAIAVLPTEFAEGWDELKTFCERIGDNTVSSLHLRIPYDYNSMAEFYEPISRVGRHSLKLLCLSVCCCLIHAERNVFIHSLFCNCTNITELDLINCRFRKDICEPLSKLKHLTKVQLLECAISSKYGEGVEISKPNLLTFVKNCRNITHFEVRGCQNRHLGFSCCLTDDDLQALDELRNLKSLTLYEISGITEWTFLENILEHCKFLITLRISARYPSSFYSRHIPMLLGSATFLKHLALASPELHLEPEGFWNLLSHAKNLERLCIESMYMGPQKVPFFLLETLKTLPRLHVLHLHGWYVADVQDFYDEMRRMFEERESDCRFSFEIILGNRRNTWINHETGCSLIFNKVLPLNKAELCDMIPILDIPRF